MFFTLVVTPEGQPGLAQQIAGQFMRLPAPPATMDLRPRAFTDPRQGVYALRVNNPGAVEVTFALSASAAARSADTSMARSSPIATVRMADAPMPDIIAAFTKE